MERTLEIDFTTCGIEVYQPYEGTSLSVTTRKVEYLGEHLPNCIHLQYRVSVAPDTTLSEQEYVNRVLLEEGHLLLQSLSLLLNCPSQYLGHKARLDGIDVKLKLPPQDFPLGLYNVVAMWDRPLTTIRYSSVVHNDRWPLLETLVSEFRQKPTALRKRLTLPLRWFTKAADEMASLDRLVAFWISFNALYADPYKSERDAISSYIKIDVDPFIAQRYVDSNEQLLLILSSFPIELRGGRQIAQELAQALKASPRNYTNVVEIAALTIYGIRCALFHGKCDPDSEDDRRHIRVAERLLSRLVRELIAKQMLGYPLTTTKFATQEKLGP